MTRRARAASPPAGPTLPGLDGGVQLEDGLVIPGPKRPAKARAPRAKRPEELVQADDPWEGLPIKPLSLDDLTCGEAEVWARARGIFPLIGIDEAGRGPLAGPVVVAACALPDVALAELESLDDSKRLDEATRDALFEPIKTHALGYAIAVIDHLTIDTMNILRASLHGMAVAWRDLVTRHPELARSPVLIDGRDRAPLPDTAEQRPLIKGDARSRNIAAASILAKVTRDRLMIEAHQTWPLYGFDRHKGYPTPAHRRAVAEHGPCPIHRRSFSFVAEHDR